MCMMRGASPPSASGIFANSTKSTATMPCVASIGVGNGSPLSCSAEAVANTLAAMAATTKLLRSMGRTSAGEWGSVRWRRDALEVGDQVVAVALRSDGDHHLRPGHDGLGCIQKTIE